MSRLPWRRARLGASVLVALALALAACTPRWAQQATADRGSRPTVHACQVCGEPLAPTERTATRWARTERLFTCAGGHEAWIPEPESPRSSQGVVSDPCPSCGQQLTWTGQTRGEGKAAVKVYGCPSGHTVDRVQR